MHVSVLQFTSSTTQGQESPQIFIPHKHPFIFYLEKEKTRMFMFMFVCLFVCIFLPHFFLLLPIDFDLLEFRLI